jgi:hypothetical protein
MTAMTSTMAALRRNFLLKRGAPRFILSTRPIEFYPLLRIGFYGYSEKAGV